MNFSPRVYSWRQVLATLAVLTIVFSLSFFRVFETTELAAYDFLLKLKSPQPISDRIVLIEIGDDTLKALGEWPIPRNYYVALLNILKDAGARRVVFDLLLSDPRTFDDSLAVTLKTSPPVYLPYAFDLPQRPVGFGAARVERILASVTPALRKNTAKGHINAFVDPDGKYRRLPLFVRYRDVLVPALALRVAADELGLDLAKSRINIDEVVVDQRLRLPVSSGTSFLINYPARWTESFKHYSFAEVLLVASLRKKGIETLIDPAVFKDKICLVGLTATATSDIKPNPLEPVYPMMGLHASVLNSFLTKNFLRQASPSANAAMSLVIFLLSLAACLTTNIRRAFVRIAGLVLVYMACVLMLFLRQGFWLDVVYPLLVVAITYISVLFATVLKEARLRQLLEKELEIASKIQQSFLPGVPETFAGLKLAGFLKPAKFVGGDLYDIIPQGQDRVWVLIADVAGKGAAAALVMAQVISLFRVFVTNLQNPAEVLASLNRELVRILGGRFVTAQCLLLDTKTKKAFGASAGHPAALFSPAQGQEPRQIFPASGPPLGLSLHQNYETQEVTFDQCSAFLLYTDGWTEARNAQEKEFGLARLKESWQNQQRGTPRATLESLASALSLFEGYGMQHDDITAVLIESEGR